MAVARHGRWLRWTLLGMLLVSLVLAAAACGGDDETTTTAAPTTTAPPTTAPPATGTPGGGDTTTSVSVTFTGDEAVIAENFTNFFDGSQPMEGKAALLEDGDQYTAELEAQAANPLAMAASAAVTGVTISSPTTADVTFGLMLSGQMALPDQTGQAVLQDGVWKVSADTFLALAALQGGAIPSTSSQ